MDDSFFRRLLSRKLLVTLGAIVTALASGATTTHTIIVAVVAAVYVIAEAALDASNKRDMAGDVQRGIDLASRAKDAASPTQPVVVNVTSTSIPPPAPAADVNADIFERVRRGELSSEDATKELLGRRTKEGA